MNVTLLGPDGAAEGDRGHERVDPPLLELCCMQRGHLVHRQDGPRPGHGSQASVRGGEKNPGGRQSRGTVVSGTVVRLTVPR